MFFGAGDDDEVAVVDWQVSGQFNGLYDVAYFLGSSVSVEVRRETERDLLAEYTDIVCGMGATGFTFDDCWRLYRQNMLGRLLVTIFVCGGLDLNDERSRRLAEIGVRRALAAIEDLDAGEFLPARRPLLSVSNAFLEPVTAGVSGIPGTALANPGQAEPMARVYRRVARRQRLWGQASWGACCYKRNSLRALSSAG